MIFRELKDDFFKELKPNGKLHCILDFERKHRKSFMVEIRDDFLDLYFLGHSIEVKKKEGRYHLIASNEFDPKKGPLKVPTNIIKPYGEGKWQIGFDDINKNSKWFEEIMTAVIAQIVRHKKGSISEGVSEVNHFIDNRAIGKNGILIIDRQVVYPGNKKDRVDLLGLKRLPKRLPSGNFVFSVIELKNKNNNEIKDVFTGQVKRYIDLVYDKYDDFVDTYTEVLKQKVKLRLLKPVDCKIASKSEISKKDIEGIAILDNYNINSDLKADGLLTRAIRDWSKVGSEYTIKLFLKTNVLDSTFFLDRTGAEALLDKYKLCNS